MSTSVLAADRRCAVGIDYGTLSGPAVVVRVHDGAELGSAITPLPKLPVAHAVWSPRPSLPTSAEAWLIAGGPHHTVLTASVSVEALADFAAMSGTELLVIDEDTTLKDFGREVRWNAAYYRLAGGL